MSKLFMATAMTALLSSGAYAATFSGNFSISGDAFSDPGLVVSADPMSGISTFDLDVGDSITFDLFDIWTNEEEVNSDDLDAQSISVSFDLTSPVASGSLGGSSNGAYAYWGLFQGGELNWGSPISLLFGNGGRLDLALSDETFNWSTIDDDWSTWGGTIPGQNRGATVQLTATFVSDSISAVPLPASMPLLAVALGGLGYAARRRRKS